MVMDSVMTYVMQVKIGRADAFVPASTDGEFVDYTFTVDDLSEFNGFQIKIVSSGTNEAEAPSFKDLRVIALA